MGELGGGGRQFRLFSRAFENVRAFYTDTYTQRRVYARECCCCCLGYNPLMPSNGRRFMRPGALVPFPNDTPSRSTFYYNEITGQLKTRARLLVPSIARTKAPPHRHDVEKHRQVRNVRWRGCACDNRRDVDTRNPWRGRHGGWEGGGD